MLESLARLEPLMEDRPTRFELLTAAALAWFADEAVDMAVVEVGLGGRWDCTNVVEADVAVLTNVSFDHTEVLGPTLEDIARDKSGIFKPGSRVVIGETDPTLVASARPAAAEAGAAETWVRGRDFACTANRMAVGGRLLDIRTPGASYGELLLPLHGAHQGENASCALAAVEAFFGSPLADDVVEAGLAEVSVPGRLEVVGRHPLVVVDGAHNVGRHDRAGPVTGRGVRGRRRDRGRGGHAHRARSRGDAGARCSPPACGPWWPARPGLRGRCRPRRWRAAAAGLGMAVTRGHPIRARPPPTRSPAPVRTTGWSCAARCTSWPTPGASWSHDAA